MFQWNTRAVNPDGTLKGAPKAADGAFRGYAAHGYGDYLPGGNPIYQGPVREYYGTALSDCDPDSPAALRIVGYSF